MSARVTFRFPADIFVRYADRIPRGGELVHDAYGRVLAVASMEPDGTGRYEALCVPPVEYARLACHASEQLLATAECEHECAVELMRTRAARRNDRRRISA
jgi:hypothetical protein